MHNEYSIPATIANEVQMAFGGEVQIAPGVGSKALRVLAGVSNLIRRPASKNTVAMSVEFRRLATSFVADSASSILSWSRLLTVLSSSFAAWSSSCG